MMNMPCHEMPDGKMMGNCEDQEEAKNHSKTFSKDPTGLPEVVSTEVVQLEDGAIYDMTAEIVQKEINGKAVRMLAYNRQVPGPTIKVAQGSTVTLIFQNKTDIETLFHSHGLRLDNRFDGTQLTQVPIEIGETFEYTLSFPDAGVYWYHPHIREDYTQESGLYGNYLVVPSNKDYWAEVDDEELLVLDDLSLESDGTLESFYKDHGTKTLMGRFGNHYFVNGNSDETFEVSAGNTTRFFLTNVANTRTFNIQFSGAELKRVGADASKYEREELVNSVVLAPSERVVVEVRYPQAGNFEVLNVTPGKRDPIASVIVVDTESSTIASFENLRENNDVIEEINQYRTYFDQEPDKKLLLTIDLKEMMNMDHSAMGHDMEGMMDHSSNHADGEEGLYTGVEWEDLMPMMNNMSTSDNVSWDIMDEQTGKQNMNIDWSFRQGDVVKIRIQNDANSAHPMQHPFHIHGQRFLVLERDGVRNDNLAWKDTTLIRTGETVDIVVEMSNIGKWMAHCHIAEHLEAGMMMGFEVLP